MNKTIDIQILEDDEELISSVCHKDTITLTIKRANGSYRIALIEKNDNGLFRIIPEYNFLVSKVDKVPLIKTTPPGEDKSGGLRAYTI